MMATEGSGSHLRLRRVLPEHRHGSKGRHSEVHRARVTHNEPQPKARNCEAEAIHQEARSIRAAPTGENPAMRRSLVLLTLLV
jgi:hypothetical protein